MIARPTMRRAQIYEDDLVTVELKRAIMTMDKPRLLNFITKLVSHLTFDFLYLGMWAKLYWIFLK